MIEILPAAQALDVAFSILLKIIRQGIFKVLYKGN